MTLDASVIIPTTGRRLPLLLRALDSVDAQTLQPKETIVVVDGDEADRARVAAAVRRSRATIVATGEPRGASAARNAGAVRARGLHLCFLDDDDVWKPSYLATVFAMPRDFDVALTAFEKHNQDGARPEKIPPTALREEVFRVRNPGLRGSNLVIARAAFDAVGGFDEGLVSFNDLDIGIRLSRSGALRYRRITEPLVEYHAHEGERLSARGAPTIQPGMCAFLKRHEPAMSSIERAAFRRRAFELWDVDPWTVDRLSARADQALREGDLPRCFPALLLAFETLLLEASAHGDAHAEDVQCRVDYLCHAFEDARSDESRLERIRFVVITTDSSKAPERLIESLLKEADRSGWRPAARAGEPWFEVLFVENDTIHEIRDAHCEYVAALRDSRLRIVRAEVPSSERPLPTSLARPLAMERARELGWTPSWRVPLWFLDEDFRFEMLLPSRERGYRLAPGGSLLHRTEQLVREAAGMGVAGLVGGNSLAAPVPAAGLLRRQLADLTCPLFDGNTSWRGATEVRERLARSDAYYDLSAESAAPPASWREAWWRSDKRWNWDEVFERLARGLPVSRPALPVLPADAASAWGSFEPALVSGGNTLILDRAALRPDLFVARGWRGIPSRRGDSVWCVRTQRAGARVVSVSLPLAHDRRVSDCSAEDAVERAIRDAHADALGVGVHRAFALRDGPTESEILAFAESRRSALVSGLRLTREELADKEGLLVPESFLTRMRALVERLIDASEAAPFHRDAARLTTEREL